MTDLQALITGAIAGALMKAEEEVGLLIDVEAIIDEDQQYTGQIKVTGRGSGETVLIAVMAEADLGQFDITAPIRIVPEAT
jgi:hypothetical protein